MTGNYANVKHGIFDNRFSVVAMLVVMALDQSELT